MNTFTKELPHTGMSNDSSSFYTNHNALSRHHGSLAERLRNLSSPTDTEFSVIPSKNKALTVSVATGSSHPQFLHSAYDPVREGEDIAAHEYDPAVGLFIVVGFGAGHHCIAVHKRLTPAQRLIILEPHPALFRAVLAAGVYRELCQDERVTFIVDADEGRREEKLKTILFRLLFSEASLVRVRVLPFYERWPRYAAYAQGIAPLVHTYLDALRGITTTIREYVATLRAEGTSKVFLGDFKQCLAQYREKAAGSTPLRPVDVGMLSTYFLFSYYSYAEAYAEGAAGGT